jgi:hypothetical protein
MEGGAMMTELLRPPQRRAFASRDDFGAAYVAIFAELADTYSLLPTLSAPPAWASTRPGVNAFNVSLPLAIIADVPKAEGAALNSALNHMIRLGKVILEMARVEAGGTWALWLRTD